MWSTATIFAIICFGRARHQPITFIEKGSVRRDATVVITSGAALP